MLAKAELGVFTTEVVRPVPAGAAAEVLHAQPRSGLEPGARGSGVAPAGRVPATEFHGCEFGLPEKADVIFCRNVIIYFDRPTQEQLLQKLTRQLVAGRIHVRGPRRDSARYGSAAGAGGPGAVQEESMAEIETELAGGLSAAGRDRIWRASPAILRTLLGSCVGVTFWSPRWAWARSATDAAALSASGLPGRADGYRYVDFAIRDLARQFDALGRAAAKWK